ncbi:MAG: hypothetical protein D6B27_08030 [Gammaproteobacteria bacterium]|nr:MAG: hypothetical protein D6B27_08030 [Gammaproteobacteria bacterium]
MKLIAKYLIEKDNIINLAARAEKANVYKVSAYFFFLMLIPAYFIFEHRSDLIVGCCVLLPLALGLFVFSEYMQIKTKIDLNNKTVSQYKNNFNFSEFESIAINSFLGGGEKSGPLDKFRYQVRLIRHEGSVNVSLKESIESINSAIRASLNKEIDEEEYDQISMDSLDKILQKFDEGILIADTHVAENFWKLVELLVKEMNIPLVDVCSLNFGRVTIRTAEQVNMPYPDYLKIDNAQIFPYQKEGSLITHSVSNGRLRASFNKQKYSIGKKKLVLDSFFKMSLENIRNIMCSFDQYGPCITVVHYDPDQKELIHDDLYIDDAQACREMYHRLLHFIAFEQTPVEVTDQTDKNIFNITCEELLHGLVSEFESDNKERSFKNIVEDYLTEYRAVEGHKVSINPEGFDKIIEALIKADYIYIEKTSDDFFNLTDLGEHLVKKK